MFMHVLIASQNISELFQYCFSKHFSKVTLVIIIISVYCPLILCRRPLSAVSASLRGVCHAFSHGARHACHGARHACHGASRSAFHLSYVPPRSGAFLPCACPHAFLYRSASRVRGPTWSLIQSLKKARNVCLVRWI